MTLQDVLKILDLNPLWKEASSDEKVTAINQFLNDLIVSDKLEDTDTIKKYTYQIELYDSVTFKNLQKVFEIDYSEEEIFWLFQYTLLEHSILNPYDISFVTSPYFEKSFMPFTLRQSVGYDNSARHIKTSETFDLANSIKYKLQPKAFQETVHSFSQSTSYDIMDSFVASTLSLDYLVTYNIWE